MKKSERDHLKEDPFQLFIHSAVEILGKYKKEIFIGLAAIAAVIIIVAAGMFIHSSSVASENRLYSEALNIKNDAKMSLDEKIEKLGAMDTKSGISAAVKLFLASLYFEKGEFDKAAEALEGFSRSSIPMINAQKKLLDANILISSDKYQEALELLNQLISDPEAGIAKDYILLKMARVQVKTGQVETAINNLNKLIEEHPQSNYSYEARTLLGELEDK
jgi:predicted negative regulator of RcsB-dependent stress response